MKNNKQHSCLLFMRVIIYRCDLEDNTVTKAKRFDMQTAQFLPIFYVVANTYFIMQASSN